MRRSVIATLPPGFYKSGAPVFHKRFNQRPGNLVNVSVL